MIERLELTYTDVLVIRKALDRYSQTADDKDDRRDAESLQWAFKDADRVALETDKG